MKQLGDRFFGFEPMLLALFISLPFLTGDAVTPNYDLPQGSNLLVVDRQRTRLRSGRILFGSSLDGSNGDNWIVLRNETGCCYGSDALKELSMEARGMPE